MSTEKIEKVKFPEEDFVISVKYLFQEWDTINMIRIHHHEENEDVDDLLDDLEKNLIEWVLDQEVTAKDIEDYIVDVISEDIGVELEDPSVSDFAIQVLKIYSSLEKTGKHPVVEEAKNKMKKLDEKKKKFQEERKILESKKKQDEEIDGKDLKDEEIISDEEDDESEEKMEEDEWETVSYKGHKKNYKKKFDKMEDDDDI